MLRAALLRTPPGEPDLLLLDIHHLVVDGVSWRIIVSDLQLALRGLPLPPPTTSFRQWSRLLERRVPSPPAEEAAAPVELPVDFADGENLAGGTEAVTVALDAEQTGRLLQQLPAAFRAQVQDALLTALAYSLCEWTGTASIAVDVEGHGREELDEPVDLSRTVGWFTTMAPVALEIRQDVVDSLRAMRSRLRGLPLRLLDDGLRRAEPASTRVAFNYLGQWDNLEDAGEDGLLEPAGDAGGIGMGQAPDEPRSHVLDVTAMVADGRLQVEWSYSRELHRRETIARRAERMLEVLRNLVKG
jgi:non-ribosomal peptide synthase protein (TIGR01720 family)